MLCYEYRMFVYKEYLYNYQTHSADSDIKVNYFGHETVLKRDYIFLRQDLTGWC